MPARTPGRPARVVLLALVVAGSLGACSAPDPVPAPASARAASSAPPAPSTPATDPAAPTPAAAPLTLHPEGRIDGFPPNAPEADVVAHLTERLGAAPETLDAEHACAPAGQPGRLLAWPGLRLAVLTTDPEGGDTDPYVGGWALLDDEGGAPELATAEGLRVGDPEARITELYPAAVGSDGAPDGARSWLTRGAAGDHTIVVTGEGAAAAVGAIGSRYVCDAG